MSPPLWPIGVALGVPILIMGVLYSLDKPNEGLSPMQVYPINGGSRKRSNKKRKHGKSMKRH
jgi:hypothetical protein